MFIYLKGFLQSEENLDHLGPLKRLTGKVKPVLFFFKVA